MVGQVDFLERSQESNVPIESQEWLYIWRESGLSLTILNMCDRSRSLHSNHNDSCTALLNGPSNDTNYENIEVEDVAKICKWNLSFEI